MGSAAAPPPGLYVQQLANHAGDLRREARAAFERGDFERAERLLADAEMLAADVGTLVDALEERQDRDLLMLMAHSRAGVADRFGPDHAGTQRRSRGRLGAALGASIAMTLALAEC